MARAFGLMGLFIILTTILISESVGQVNYKFLTGAQRDNIDTVSRGMTIGSINEASGLLETEINPDKYTVGQNDEFSIAILSAAPRQLEVRISPDGTMLIPTVGKLDLKGKTLTEAIKLMEDLIKKTLSSRTPNEIHIVLKNIRRFKVSVSGSVAKSGILPATAADRVSVLIDKAGGLKFDASMRNIILLRDENKQRIKVDLLKYYLLGDEDSNPFLLGGDKIIIPPSSDKSLIGLYGEVTSPGVFEYIEGDSLSTLIRFGLGFAGSATLDSVEFVRTESNQTITKKYLDLNSWRDFFSQKTALTNDFPLQSGDRIYIRKKRDWQKLEYVVIKGEINYPGYYAIEENKEKISDVIARAGGFTDDAAIQSIEYIRQSELDKPDREMERLDRILPSEMSKSESRYYQARKLEKRGVVSIDFGKIMNNQQDDDNLFVLHRDSIVVPSKKSFVNVQGRVVNPGLIIFKPNLTYLDYINLAGGFGFRADEGETIVNKLRGGLFRAKDRNYVLEPGDVILVPPEKELTFMEVFTVSLTIVTQLLTIAGVLLAISNVTK